MASYTTLADKALVRGSVSVTIDGYTYLLKTGARSKPVKSNVEFGATGLPLASSHVVDFQKITGEILAYTGTPEPSQLVAFSYDSKYWAVGNLTLNYATEGLRAYSCEILQLAGTVAGDFVGS